MSKYKLVSVEPIRRAIDTLERFANDTLAGRNSAHELRELLAAAPAVQGEPDVARHDAMWFALSEMVKWYENISLGNNPAFQYYNLAKKALLPASPQPAEQQPATLRSTEEAPKDGTVILAWCVHEADPYYDDETGRLTAYGANAEGMAHVDDGWNLVHWQESFFDGECHVPGWWTLADGYGETAANPVLWVPLPTNPKPEDIPGTGNSLERG